MYQRTGPMIDTDLFKQNLMVSSLAMAADKFLKPSNKHYLWSRLPNNIFGVEGIRARVGNFEIPWTGSLFFPVPDLEQSFNESLPNIIDQRALEIFNYSQLTGKKIVVMWSGGIDSTCILSAFIKNLSAADLENIVVCTSISGVEENPYFYDTLIRNRFQMLHLQELNVTTDFLQKNLLIHGDPGDCILGPSISKYSSLIATNQHLLTWKDHRPMLYHLYYDLHAPMFATWWVDKVSDNLNELQNQGKFLNVKTISDWHWWNYFNFKWQDGVTRALSCCKKNIKEKIGRDQLDEYFKFCFFGHGNFQVWSYQNLHNLIPTNPTHHKKLFKDYIYELDKNSTYLTYKQKVPSRMPDRYRPLVIDLDGVHHNYRDPGMPELVSTVFEC
jgi:hypothetical protein